MKKTSILSLTFALIIMIVSRHSYAQRNNPIVHGDTIKLMVDSSYNIFYQKTVKVVNNVTTNVMLDRVLQLMAAKNFVQNYNDDRQLKLIFTTTQDLNINPVYVGDDNDTVEPYSAQFAITIDVRPGRYRYTISNVLFFIPTGYANKRETLNEVYIKAMNTESKRVAKNAKLLLASFERYLFLLSHDLNQAVEGKLPMYSPQF